MGSDRDTFVAEDQGRVVGTYFLQPIRLVEVLTSRTAGT
jgi:hypothetical protein